jgi:hypothetical protein
MGEQIANIILPPAPTAIRGQCPNNVDVLFDSSEFSVFATKCPEAVFYVESEGDKYPISVPWYLENQSGNKRS